MLGAQVRPTVCCVVATPAPLADRLDAGFVALLVILNVVEVEPLLLGLKFTPTEILCPAAIVLGRVRLLSVNSGFVVVAARIIIGAAPALKVAVFVEVAPTTTLPKLKLVGETVNALLLALPDKATDTFVAFCAATLKVPLKVPAVLGTNFSRMLMLLPTPRLNGAVIPEYLNAPVTDVEEICTVVLPLFFKVT